MKMYVHVKILNLCLYIPVVSRSPYKIVHHYLLYQIAVIN
jgi:hypothetical protein